MPRSFRSSGPRDRQGRSLRDLDLERRLFKYPCSYLIYSPAFDGAASRDAGLRLEATLGRALCISRHEAKFKHLSKEDRQAIVEILRDTKARLARRIGPRRVGN